METIESKYPHMELIESLASQHGIDAQQFIQNSGILDDLGQFEVDRENRDQKFFGIFSGMGYEKELEMMKQKARADRIQLALVLFSRRQAKLCGQDNELAA